MITQPFRIILVDFPLTWNLFQITPSRLARMRAESEGVMDVEKSLANRFNFNGFDVGKMNVATLQTDINVVNW